MRRALNSTKRTLGYGPLLSLQALDTFGALDAFAIASMHTQDPSGSPVNFAATAAKLWHIQAAAWADVSKVGGYTTGASSRWESTVFQSNAAFRRPLAIFTNFDDPVQVYEIGASALFANLTANVAQPSGPTAGAPRARHIAVIGQHVHLGYTYDGDDGLVPNRGWWSQLGNASSWPVPGTTAAVSAQSDRNVFFGDAGAITAIVGGSTYGVYFQERAVHRADYQGGDLIYNFTRVESNRGCAVPGLAIPFGSRVLYFSEEGWFVFDGSGSTAVGEGKINRFFRNDFVWEFRHRVSYAVDPDAPIIKIGYVGAGHDNGQPNKYLLYNWAENDWTDGEEEHDHVAVVVNPGPDLSIDAEPTTIPDDEEGDWDDVETATRVVGGFDPAHQLATATGSALAAQFDFADLELSPGQRSLYRAARPLVTFGQPSVAVAKRSTLADTLTYGAPQAMRDTGVCRQNADARYHALRMLIDAGWTGDMIGLDVDYTASGRR